MLVLSRSSNSTQSNFFRSLKPTSKSTDQEQQLLYQHFIESALQQREDQLIDRFRHLFLEERDYEDQKVRQALQKILKSSQAKQDFKQVLTHCCYILIDRWYQNQNPTNITRLIDLFKQVSPPHRQFYRSATRKRQLVYDFLSTEEYQKLQRFECLIKLITQPHNPNNSVGELITRYFCLHESYLLGHNSDRTARAIVSQIKRQIKQQYQQQLLQFIVDIIRQQADCSNQFLSLNNPTLLTNSELIAAIQHFINPVEGARNYRDLAQDFRIKIPTQSEQFKESLYKYLTVSTNNKYGQHCFNRQLEQTIEKIIPQTHGQLDDLFWLRIGQQLFNFLVIDNFNPRNHYRFIDLITNIGVIPTVGLLLKILLLNPKLKPILEQKFVILLLHYKTAKPEQVPWLIKSLEMLQLVLSIYFHGLDLTYAKQIKL